jgi:Zn-dependent M28 family amino/carboxypeptidase
MKHKIFNFFIRQIILIFVGTGVLIAIVTQPVLTKNTQHKPLASILNLKTIVYELSETIPDKTPIADLFDSKVKYLFDSAAKLHTNVRYQSYDVQGVEYKNVVVKFNGTKQCGMYVIGAHFDTEENLPGADDNSSGVAGLMELVRLFAQYPPACKTELVFYNLEEPPYFRSEYMGSYVHAKSLKESQEDVELMLSLEMIGYFSDDVGSQNYPIPAMQYLYSDKGDFISIVGNMSQISITRSIKKSMRNATSLPVYSINAPSFVAGIDFSDHLNYWYFGYPALMITDTAFNRNKNYHTEEDTIEKLDFKRMAQVVDAVFYSINQP